MLFVDASLGRGRRPDKHAGLDVDLCDFEKHGAVPADGAVITHCLRERRQDRYSLGDDNGNVMSAQTTPAIGAYGALAPGLLDRAVIAMTGGMPVNWLGMRLASGLRRIVMKRLPEDGGVDVIRWGLRLRLHPLHNGCEKGLLFTPQFYEADERSALAARIAAPRAVDQPFVFVDIGANVGLFSFFVASRAHGNARILAIEPEPENLRRLRFNIDANPDLPIRVLSYALGDSAGTVALEVNAVDRGGTRTRPVQESSGDTVQVECKRLAQVLAEEGVTRIDALKIDVEGVEDQILVPFFKGEPDSLWPRFLIIADSRASWRADLFAEMQARGYRIADRTKRNVMLELMPAVG
jgi:FkbM family methyltransferase